MVENKTEQSQAVVDEGSLIGKYYRKYRSWVKGRRREKKRIKTMQAMMGFYGNFIKKGDLCFDIGANMGNRTEVFLGLGAKVIAVEPQESCAEILREKFEGNDAFVLVNKALDKVEGQREFFISNAHTLCSMSKEWIERVQENHYFEGCVWEDKKITQTTTMDELIKLYGRPAFCKIDVEGFEYDVLQGLTQPVHIISFEYTWGVLEPAKKSIDYLAGLGEIEFNYSEGESMLLALANWVSREEIIDILNSLSGDILFGDIYARFINK